MDIKKRKGIIFTMDAMFASILLITALILIINTSYMTSDSNFGISYASNDIINSFSNIKISELNNSIVKGWISSGIINNTNNTLLEQIGEFYVLNKSEYANNLSRILSEELIPDKHGFSIIVNGEEVYKNSINLTSNLVTSRRLISGIEKYKPIRGATSKVYLSGINERSESSYLYFGGFIGQGNITGFIDDIPSDADIRSAYIETDNNNDFDFFINDNFCMRINETTPTMIPDKTNIDSCKDYFIANAKNNISLNFYGDINQSFIAGGFLRVDYTTQEMNFENNNIVKKYYFLGVDGISNIYDSFYIPGTLNSMNVHIHFKSNYTTYMTVGDRTIFEIDGDLSDQIIDINDDNLTSFPVLLQYDFLSNKTIPLRFASYDIELEVILQGGNADVILITDMSGSMKSRMGEWGYPPYGNAIPTCKESDIIDPSSRKLGVAGCLDSEFVDVVMNESNQGNRLWLVDFSENANPFYTNVLPDITKKNLQDEINTRYKSAKKEDIDGGTCLCCAINQAYDILDAYSNSSRIKAVIVMSDGIPTYGCGAGGINGTETTAEYYPAGCIGDDSDCGGNDCKIPIDNSIWSAKRLHEDLNTTVYAVGFGPLESCFNANDTLTRIAEEGNGSLIISTDGAVLREFYQNVSTEIMSKITQSSQTISTKGNVSSSIIYSDSYIEFNYTPNVEPTGFGEISLTIEEDLDSCNFNVTIPSQIRIVDSKVTSYSAEHWTKRVLVNNITQFDIDDYTLIYPRLGDPFVLQIFPDSLNTSMNNSIEVITGDNTSEDIGCSDNNKLIYRGGLKASVSYSDVLEKVEGCNWTVDYDNGGNGIFLVPPDYIGSKECSYTSTIIDYDVNDTYDDAMYKLMKQLDFDDDGKIFVDLDENNLVINSISIMKIPYPWGPTISEVRIWK